MEKDNCKFVFAMARQVIAWYNTVIITFFLNKNQVNDKQANKQAVSCWKELYIQGFPYNLFSPQQVSTLLFQWQH